MYIYCDTFRGKALHSFLLNVRAVVERLQFSIFRLEAALPTKPKSQHCSALKSTQVMHCIFIHYMSFIFSFKKLNPNKLGDWLVKNNMSVIHT